MKERLSLIIANSALMLMPLVAAAETIESIIKSRILVLVNPLISVVVGLALVFFFWGLAQFIFSAGSEEGRKRGKQVMLWGIISLFVILSVWGIVELLQFSVFGRTIDSPAPFRN